MSPGVEAIRQFFDAIKQEPVTAPAPLDTLLRMIVALAPDAMADAALQLAGAVQVRVQEEINLAGYQQYLEGYQRGQDEAAGAVREAESKVLAAVVAFEQSLMAAYGGGETLN